MKIDYQPDVFDDAEYCTDGVEYCDRLRRHSLEYYCTLFDNNELNNINTGGYFKPIKCDECKEHYAAKIPPNPLPEGHRLG